MFERRAARRLILSSVWPLGIPIAYYLPQSLRLNTFFPAGQFPEVVRRGLRRVAVENLLVAVLISFALSLVVCWVVNRRRNSTASLAVRVLVDAGMVMAFLAAPWVAALLIWGRSARRLFDIWVAPPGASQIPCVCALLAGLSFWLMSRAAKEPRDERSA